MKLLNLGIFLLPFLLINVSESKVERKTVERNSACICITPNEMIATQGKFQYLSDTLGDLETKLNPLVELNIAERLEELEKKTVPSDLLAKIAELEAKLALVGENQVAIKSNKDKIEENKNKIQGNADKAKTNENKIEINSQSFKTNSAKINENSDKLSENGLKIQDNTKKSDTNSRDIKSNLDKLKDYSGKIDANSENVAKVSSLADQNSKNSQANAEKISKNSKTAEENAKKIDSVSKRANENSADISNLLTKIPSPGSESVVTKEDLDGLKKEVDQQLNAHGLEIKKAANDIKSVDQDLEATKTDLEQKAIAITENKNGLKLTAEEIAKLKAMSSKNKMRSLSPYSDRIRKLKALAYVWKIPDVSKKMAGKKWVLESEVFRLHGFPFGAKLRIQPSEFSSDEVGISISFRDLLSDPASLQVLPFPEVTYVVKDLSGGAQPKHRVAPHSVHLGSDVSGGGAYVFEEYLMFKKRLMSGGFVKGDSMVVEVYVETPDMTHQSQSFDGKMVDSVDQLKWRIGLAKDYFEWWTSSPYFYTHPQGYRVQVQLWLHYNEKIVPQVLFLSGDNDKDLPLSFAHKTTITVFNMKDPTANLVRSVDAELADSTMYELPGFTYDEVRAFLDNDTLYYKVTIEPRTA